MKKAIYKVYFIFLISVFLIFLIFINKSKAQGLIFSEIMYNPQGTDTGNEWFEIFNNSTSSIIIDSTWRFNDGSNHLINFSGNSGEILAETFFVISSNKNNFLNKYPDYNKQLFESSFSLNNTSGILKFLQGTNLITEQSYNSTLGGNDNDKSIEREDFSVEENTWRESYVNGGTPGEVPSTPLPNNPPTAVAGSDVNIFLGNSIVFDASLSSDLDGDFLNFSWFIENELISTEKTFFYEFYEEGIYNVYLVVSDGASSSTDSLIVEVVRRDYNTVPNVHVDLVEDFYNINDIINFNACSSSDAEDDGLNFYWDFADNTSSTDCNVNHVYSDIGNYNVQLIVGDGIDNSTWSKNINITNNTKVVLNEIFPNPKGSDDSEWIEIKNIGDMSVNLENWYLQDESGKKYIFSKNNFDSLILLEDQFITVEYSISKITLNNSSEKIFLFDGSGNKVDETFYLNAPESQSFARFENSWQWTKTITPSTENIREIILKPEAIIDISGDLIVNKEILFSASNSYDSNGYDLEYKWYIGNSLKARTEEFSSTFNKAETKQIKLVVINTEGLEDEEIKSIEIKKDTASTSSESGDYCFSTSTEGKIIISEIFPNPKGKDDGEFIEIYNPNSSDIDITNWKLNDTSKTFYKLGGVLKTGEYLVIEKNISKISLNNSNEEVKLFDCAGNLIWKIFYDKSFEDKSYSYETSNKNYFWTNEISPGEENTYEENLEDKLQKELDEAQVTDISLIKSADKNQTVFVTGIVTALQDELYKNMILVCDFDIFSKSTNYENCVYVYSKEFPKIDYGSIVQIYGNIYITKNINKVKIKNKEDVLVLEKYSLSEIEVLDIDDVNDDLLGNVLGVSGVVKKKNKKSFDLKIDDIVFRIKIYNSKINLDNINLEDSIFVYGVLEKYNEQLILIPRNNNDIVKQQVLGIQELSSTSSVKLNQSKKNNTFLVLEKTFSSLFSKLTKFFTFIKNKVNIK